MTSQLYSRLVLYKQWADLGLYDVVGRTSNGWMARMRRSSCVFSTTSMSPIRFFSITCWDCRTSSMDRDPMQSLNSHCSEAA